MCGVEAQVRLSANFFPVVSEGSRREYDKKKRSRERIKECYVFGLDEAKR